MATPDLPRDARQAGLLGPLSYLMRANAGNVTRARRPLGGLRRALDVGGRRDAEQRAVRVGDENAREDVLLDLADHLVERHVRPVRRRPLAHHVLDARAG